MNVLATVVDGILAAVSQRPFWTQPQIKEFVRDHYEKKVRTLYESTNTARSEIRMNDLRAMRIFATDQQQTWLVVYSRMANCVLDDRRREEPRMQWRTKLESVLPVQADESWSTTAGVLHFGNRTKGWLYSKELFQDESVSTAISRFLSQPESTRGETGSL